MDDTGDQEGPSPNPGPHLRGSSMFYVIIQLSDRLERVETPDIRIALRWARSARRNKRNYQIGMVMLKETPR